VIVGCPTCGAEVEFRYDDSFVRVCGHCSAAVVRTDRGVDTLGRFADLVPISSALQLFAEGRYGTTGFLLIGTAQLRHAAGGVWQEWYAKLDGGKWAWISEAQGRLYLTFERPDVPAPPIAQLAPGVTVPLAGATFTVAERGTATYVSARGEIPYRLAPSATFQFVDLSDGRGGFATIDYGDGSEPPVVYLGSQITPAELGLSGGEAAPQLARPAAGARLACPHCGGSLELRVPDQTLRVACPFCNTLVSVEGGTLAIIAKQGKKPTPLIALGTKGTFLEGELTVIGYVARSACIEATWWPFDEYLLYAPSVGFRWLVCSDGHWSYVQPVATGAVSVGVNARYDGVSFQRFQSAELRVDSVLGEFYWRVQVGERVRAEDYIAPPAMLSIEATKSEQNWSLSTYLTTKDIDKAFGKPLGLARPIGVGPNQPYGAGFGSVMALVTVAFFAAGIGKCVTAPEAEKLRQHFAVPMTAGKSPPTPSGDATLEELRRHLTVPMDAGKPTPTPSGDSSGVPTPVPSPVPTPVPPPMPVVDPTDPAATPAAGSDTASAEPPGDVKFSNKFQLDGGENVEFALSSDVSNNWVYATLDLVNDATGSVVDIEKTIEYYSGYDEDGSWTEGSTTAEEVIGPVDPGTYVLRVESQHGGLGDVDLGVVIRQGVFRWVWFWLFFGVLLIPFGAVTVHGLSFRRRRWANSNARPTSGGYDD
jgi:hypothetical protein